jgi:hypothetical protein
MARMEDIKGISGSTQCTVEKTTGSLTSIPPDMLREDTVCWIAMGLVGADGCVEEE